MQSAGSSPQIHEPPNTSWTSALITAGPLPKTVRLASQDSGFHWQLLPATMWGSCLSTSLLDTLSWEPREGQRLDVANNKTQHAPEIVVAFVAPSGTDRGLVVEIAEQTLRRHDYDSRVVRLSEILATRRPNKPGQKETTSSRAQALQDEGNALCQEVAQRADALAFVAVDQIGEERQKLHLERGEPESLKEVNPRAE